MTIDNSTSPVTSTKSGTGWTIDVTNCNLNTDLSVKDFVVQFDGITQGNADFDKLSATNIQYTGASIGSTKVDIYRNTPVTRVQEVVYKSRLTSDLWENELNTIHKIINDLKSSTFVNSIILDSSPDPSNDGLAVPTTAWVRDLLESPDMDVDFQNNVDVTGATTLNSTLSVAGESTLTSATVSDLTNNRVVIAGTSGKLEDSASLTFDGTTFNVGNSNFTVAQSTGNTNIAGTLDVTGNTDVAGTLDVTGQTTVGAFTSSEIRSTETMPSTSDNSTLVPTTAWVQDVVTANASVGGFIKLSFLTTGTSATYTPDASTTKMVVHVQGAGGAGGGIVNGSGNACSGAGGGGELVIAYITNMSQTFTYTIGAGGTGSVGNRGGDGGSTTFSCSVEGDIVAGGGGGGFSDTETGGFTRASGGGGGSSGASLTFTGNYLRFKGNDGDDGTADHGEPHNLARSGAGYMGMGVIRAENVSADDAESYGAGGGAVFNVTLDKPGGKGGDGLIVVWEYA